MPESDAEGPLPKWFVRLVVAYVISTAGGGIWWAATMSTKMDTLVNSSAGHERRLTALEEDMKTVDDKLANLKKDVAVLDRTITLTGGRQP